MARTTDVAVSGIVEVDDSISLTPFIEVANAIVTKHCGDVVGYTAADLELIERWLAAHFYCVRDPRAVGEKGGPVSANFQSQVDLGFDVTHYGQMAMRLDWNGGLSALNNQAKTGTKIAATAGISWLGTDLEDEV